MILEIENLILRMPHRSPEEARSLSRLVMQRMQQKLPMSTAIGHIPQLKLQLSLTENMSNTQLATAISDALVASIQTYQSTDHV